MTIFDFSEEFHELTMSAAVFKATLDEVVASDLGHANEFVHKDDVIKLSAKAVEGEIEDLLKPLLEIKWRQTPIQRVLYLEMSNGMVAGFCNTINGTDAPHVQARVNQRLDVLSYILSYSENLREKGRVVSYGNCRFDKYQGKTDIRTIQVANDGGSWVSFFIGDTILDWETPEKYTLKPVRDRFSLDDLRRGMEAECITRNGQFPFTGKGVMLSRDTGVLFK